MASRYYCANVAGELEGLSEKLHSLSAKLDKVPSIDKYRLQTHIDELHIIMTELDDRLCELVVSCTGAEEVGGKALPRRTGEGVRPAPLSENFDYDFGG